MAMITATDHTLLIAGAILDPFREGVVRAPLGHMRTEGHRRSQHQGLSSALDSRAPHLLEKRLLR
jgi:hypothetical protein